MWDCSMFVQLFYIYFDFPSDFCSLHRFTHTTHTVPYSDLLRRSYLLHITNDWNGFGTYSVYGQMWELFREFVISCRNFVRPKNMNFRTWPKSHKFWWHCLLCSTLLYIPSNLFHVPNVFILFMTKWIMWSMGWLYSPSIIFNVLITPNQ